MKNDNEFVMTDMMMMILLLVQAVDSAALQGLLPSETSPHSAHRQQRSETWPHSQRESASVTFVLVLLSSE